MSDNKVGRPDVEVTRARMEADDRLARAASTHPPPPHTHAGWKLMLRVRDGHAFWREPGKEEENARIAVTDRSLRVAGDPSTTDDGLLLLTRTKPIRGEIRDRGIQFTLPIHVSDPGRASWVTPCSPEEAVLVGKMFDMPIEIQIGAGVFTLVRMGA
jgi:hypothetical protein